MAYLFQDRFMMRELDKIDELMLTFEFIDMKIKPTRTLAYFTAGDKLKSVGINTYSAKRFDGFKQDQSVILEDIMRLFELIKHSSFLKINSHGSEKDKYSYISSAISHKVREADKEVRTDGEKSLSYSDTSEIIIQFLLRQNYDKFVAKYTEAYKAYTTMLLSGEHDLVREKITREQNRKSLKPKIEKLIKLAFKNGMSESEVFGIIHGIKIEEIHNE